MHIATLGGGQRPVPAARLSAADPFINLAAAGVCDSVQELIEGGPALLARVRAKLADPSAPHAPAESALLAPIPTPKRNIFCVGKNYRAHAKEFGQSGFDGGAKGGDEIPDAPIIFSKPPSSVIGPLAGVPWANDPSDSVDYEGELAVVIGAGGQRITAANAMAHVFGYTIVNDVTARELQKRHKQWLLGKGPDGFCPMGPVIVTADAVPDVGALELTTVVNGEVRQQAHVADLIFDIPTLIETISRVISLQPGDVIATGTPVGVGIGFTPPKFLKPGDHVSVSVSHIGVLFNPIV
jgi:2-keto-4-pentenoate hydratase/2-oxohepta-3-ene-1,7-dioic acid hydratase in catechol pathway